MKPYLYVKGLLQVILLIKTENGYKLNQYKQSNRVTKNTLVTRKYAHTYEAYYSWIYRCSCTMFITPLKDEKELLKVTSGLKPSKLVKKKKI